MNYNIWYRFNVNIATNVYELLMDTTIITNYRCTWQYDFKFVKEWVIKIISMWVEYSVY